MRDSFTNKRQSAHQQRVSVHKTKDKDQNLQYNWHNC